MLGDVTPRSAFSAKHLAGARRAWRLRAYDIARQREARPRVLATARAGLAPPLSAPAFSSLMAHGERGEASGEDIDPLPASERRAPGRAALRPQTKCKFRTSPSDI